MAFLPRPVGPRAAFEDLIGFVRRRQRHQLLFAVAAIAATIVLIWAVGNEFHRTAIWKPPTIVYVQQWRGDRTLAEVHAQQAKDLPGEVAKKKAEDDAEAARREQFRKLKKQLNEFGI